MDKRKKQEILDTPAGSILNTLVQQIVMKGPSCVCGRFNGADPERAICKNCGFPPSALWSDSLVAIHHLRKKIQDDWSYPRRQRFLDYLGEAIAHRLQVGKIDARQWILLIIPEDICRAAILTSLELE